MRTVPLLGAVVIGAAVISGCGQHAGGVAAPPATGPSSGTSSGGTSSGGTSSGGTSAGTSSGGTSSGGAPGASGSGGGDAAACHGGSVPAARSVTITGADDHKTLCVARGGKVLVFLKGTPDRKWAPVRASSDVLTPSASGELALALGVTGASFLAARPGTAVISSSRPACARGVPPSNGTPGAMGCNAILAFRVTVRVTG